MLYVGMLPLKKIETGKFFSSNYTKLCDKSRRIPVTSQQIMEKLLLSVHSEMRIFVQDQGM